MKRHPRQKHQLEKASERLRCLALTLLLTLGLLVACTPKTETVTVEVTRVVTETVVEEGETVEVTRVVTETIVETVEVEPEGETIEEPPSATGSEGDAGPLPPPPEDSPKVAESRGSTPAADLSLETVVTLRGSQINNNSTSQEVLTTTFTALNPIELQKWCNLAAKLNKKRCE